MSATAVAPARLAATTVVPVVGAGVGVGVVVVVVVELAGVQLLPFGCVPSRQVFLPKVVADESVGASVLQPANTSAHP